MKYLLLAWHREENWEALAQSEREALVRACRPYDDALRNSGHLVAMEGLQSTRTAMTLQTRSGRVCITDGPYTEAKEQLGGFYLIEARDLNEAIQVAANTAAVRLGEKLGWAVEVRPIAEATPGTPGERLA
ncbi:MAG TPA: YciI family protein [Longimicrobiales bacterium]